MNFPTRIKESILKTGTRSQIQTHINWGINWKLKYLLTLDNYVLILAHITCCQPHHKYLNFKFLSVLIPSSGIACLLLPVHHDLTKAGTEWWPAAFCSSQRATSHFPVKYGLVNLQVEDKWGSLAFGWMTSLKPQWPLKKYFILWLSHISTKALTAAVFLSWWSTPST